MVRMVWVAAFAYLVPWARKPSHKSRAMSLRAVGSRSNDAASAMRSMQADRPIPKPKSRVLRSHNASCQQANAPDRPTLRPGKKTGKSATFQVCRPEHVSTVLRTGQQQGRPAPGIMAICLMVDG
jgi:hypothetical protein